MTKREPIVKHEEQREETLTIDSVATQMLSKQELIDIINRTFPDSQVYPTSKIAVLTETKMRNGIKMQTITLGMPLQN